MDPPDLVHVLEQEGANSSQISGEIWEPREEPKSLEQPLEMEKSHWTLIQEFWDCKHAGNLGYGHNKRPPQSLENKI